MKSYYLFQTLMAFPQQLAETVVGEELLLVANSLGLHKTPKTIPISNTLLLLTICAILLTVFVTWYILQKKHHQEIRQLRTQLSADLHDDVGTLLAGLAMQAELLSLTLPSAGSEKLNRLAEMSREAQSGLRDIVWSFDARKDTWQSLLDRLNDFAQEVLGPKDIRFKIQFEGIRRESVIPARLRKEFYLIGKEAIANVTRHSDANKVTLSLRQQNGQYELSIQDNGHITEQTRTAGSGLGLSNIKMRASRLGAKLQINLQHGFGVQLRMRAV